LLFKEDGMEQSLDCDHCEAETIGEVQVWEEGDIYSNKDLWLCPECGDDFVFPLAVQF
jgi:hypothetical protein